MGVKLKTNRKEDVLALYSPFILYIFSQLYTIAETTNKYNHKYCGYDKQKKTYFHIRFIRWNSVQYK